ncbi:hypothetical protein [Sunxiuqinia sp. sy24]|uniref:hypothetical protein n=1 Tax=Sunxiuqinia sp. sy24 TaxID=3461495 RepID=UPI004045CBBE
MAKGIKTGGRQKGTSNKLTGTVKEMIGQLVAKEIEHLPTILNKLEPKEKAEFIIKLLPYILPKKAPVEEPKENPTNRNRFIHSMFKAQV